MSFRKKLLLHLREKVRINYNRRTHLVFYDVTNYYFEIDQEGEFRRKGFCKHNARNPLVQMGLLLDADVMPIIYRLFKGNTHDIQTMMPLLQEVHNSYGLGSIITVADKGLNNGDNFKGGFPYITSNNIRHKKTTSQIIERTGYNGHHI